MARTDARVPRGMRDMLPEQMVRRAYVTRTIQDVFEEFGFEPLATPVLELSSTLLGKYGPDAEKLIYHASHPGGKEELALRYDLSVPLSRVVAMNPQLPRPFKRYQIAPVWRAERPQRARYREFYQCDADTVGTASVVADAETILVITAILERLGFERFDISLNNRKLLNAIGEFAGLSGDILGSLYRTIDKLDRIGIDGIRSELDQVGVEPSIVRKLTELIQIEGDNLEVLDALEGPLAGIPDGAEGIRELREILEYVTLAGAARRVQVKFTMVRGLEYYTGPIFETSVAEPKLPSITGGGRFDGLIGRFTGKEDVPATGTTIGIERIIDAMDELEMFPAELGRTVAEVLVATPSREVLADAVAVATELRRAGIKTMVYGDPASISAQMRYASAKGIPQVVVLEGKDEAVVRRVDAHESRVVPRAELAGVLRAASR